MRTVVLDAGALIALERRDGRMLALLQEIVSARMSAHVPAAVVAQVWRGSAQQHAVVRLLKAEVVRVHALTESTAYKIGVRLSASGTTDVVDAHVALLGRSIGAVVLTSDPTDLKRLEPDLDIVTV
jgi:predicted nucleic acid-binding protein